MTDYLRGYRSKAALAEIADVDDSGKQQLVSHHGLAGERHSEVYRPQAFGFSSRPPKGSTGVVLSLGGERSRSVFLGGEHDDHRPTGLKEGEAKLYDAEGNLIFFGRRNGMTVTTAKGDTTITTKDGKIILSSKGDAFVHSNGKVYLGSKDGKGCARVATESGYSSKVWAAI
jgi:phage baseplate assembly protein V